MREPLAYFISFTCYGNWLRGDERGSVDGEHNGVGTPFLPADATRHAQELERLSEPPYRLDEPRRLVVLQAVCEIARKKGWQLHAVHVRSNHVHVVVSAPDCPERVMNDIKAAASRRLNKAFPEEAQRTRWTRHGSTRYLWTQDTVADKVGYVVNGQGAPMQRYPEANATPSRARSAAE